MNWLALVAAAGVAGMGTFQILLALGLPLGHAAFGGTKAVLPTKMRAASVISARPSSARGKVHIAVT